ncbi:MAG: LysE family transporter [Candidatus Pacebacteria bacterium]|nr:LysE family transporter [Candidatus Paceibacterota bacterium]
MYLAQFFTVVIVHLLAVMSPGPDFVMVTRNSLVYSRKVGVYTSLGLGFGIAVHVTYCLLGIGLLISQSILLFNVIKYLGAGYLIYIGYKSLRAKPQAEKAEEILKAEKEISPLSAIRIGFLTNVLNPKATLFMLALFTQVINPGTPRLIEGLYGVEMVVMTFLWFSLVSVFFSNPLIKEKISKVQHHIERVTGAVLILLGIKVALSSRK